MPRAPFLRDAIGERLRILAAAGELTERTHAVTAPRSSFFVLPGEAKLRSTVNWSWKSSQHSTPTDVDTLVLPSYGLLNGRIEYVAATRWTLAAFGTNLLNKVYYAGGVDYSANVWSPLYDLGRPREWGVSVRYDF
jgi:iron complex outermembrane receptor protein